ncbi:BgTH12-04520 [Blumeria graminis f. sp. triticale]|uniref:BgTH12-04520 n=1 Tax=Blumeria graminis f. sp. triticale TaxID=1689686 RepID=A0A9W4GAX2_BLUGR|nr:BgTH12-04520 [Blumeria graminis f. sp. triticale]
MKFLVRASTAALSCLFLLVPAALGKSVYVCKNMDTMGIQEAETYANQAVPGQIYESDPESKNGVVRGAYHFSRSNADNEPGYYLVQVVGDKLETQIWKFIQGKWITCPLVKV